MNDILAYFKIDDRISTSGQPTAEQFREIAKDGFTVVINLALKTSTNALEDESSVVQSLAMSYVHIPVLWERPTLDDLTAFYGAMQTHNTQKVWVHCALNMRASCFMYLYQLCVLGLPEQQAQYPMSQIWSQTEVWAELIEAAKALTIHCTGQTGERGVRLSIDED